MEVIRIVVAIWMKEVVDSSNLAGVYIRPEVTKYRLIRPFFFLLMMFYRCLSSKNKTEWLIFNISDFKLYIGFAFIGIFFQTIANIKWLAIQNRFGLFTLSKSNG